MLGHLRILTLLACIAFLYFASPFLIPIFFSLFLAMLIDPAVEFFALKGYGRKTLIYAIAGFISLILLGLAWLAAYSLHDLMEAFAKNPRLSQILEAVRSGAGTLDSPFLSLNRIFSVDSSVPRVDVVEHYPMWIGWVRGAFGSFFEIGSFLILVPILLFYMLYEKENLVEALNSVLGPFVYLPTLNADLPVMIRTFFRANLLTGLALVLGQVILLFFLGFTNWLSLSIVVGFLNVIPIVGAPVAVLTVIAGGIIPGNEFPWLEVISGTVLLRFFLTNFILASLIGRRANVNSTALIIGGLFWSWIWGAVGFLISIPMTLLIKIFLESSSTTLPLANLMAARPTALLPEDDFTDVSPE